MTSHAVRFHLAQFNIARMRVATIEDPLMEGFVSRLDEINAIAERSPGFVWRLQTDEGNATAIRPFGDERVLINLSVWESVEALSAFVYRSRHAELVRDGKRWFEELDHSPLVLWWIPAGRTPSVEVAIERLERFCKEGPSQDAFTFRRRFPPPGGPSTR